MRAVWMGQLQVRVIERQCPMCCRKVHQTMLAGTHFLASCLSTASWSCLGRGTSVRPPSVTRRRRVVARTCRDVVGRGGGGVHSQWVSQDAN
jgi:hypothetical protein